MKRNFFLFCYSCILLVACDPAPEKDLDSMKEEIRKTEKAFEATVKEKGVAEGFFLFADDSAVIKRAHDTLIFGKENIRNYYGLSAGKKIDITWAPDYIGVSSDGTLGYTYGQYTWRLHTDSGTVSESKGVFHTVWKKQNDGSWKYVWD